MNAESNRPTDHNLGHTDVSIIGGGPVGIFASFACGMLGLKSHIFEKGSILGGQCTALYPEKFIYDIPGIPKILAQDLIDQLTQQSYAFSPTVHLDTEINQIQPNQDGVIINGIQSRAIIIAAGFGACTPIKLFHENAAKFENTQVFYQVKDPESFKGKTVAVLGGGNSAADWALHMCQIAKQVIVVHRRDAFTAFESSVQKFHQYISEGKLRVYNSCSLEALTEEKDKITGTDRLNGISLRTKDGEIVNQKVDSIIACYGMKGDLSLLNSFNLHMQKDKIIVDHTNQQTNIENVYAVGDIAYSSTKTKLFSILSGMHECTVAAGHILQKMGTNLSRLHHSSDMKT